MGEMRGRAPILAGLVLTAVAAGVLMGGSTPPPPAPGAPVTDRATSTIPETLVVHVSGMVLSPGVVHVPAGSIVADVVEAAGGLIVGASIETLNLAATVTSGEHVVVPGIDDSAPMTATESGDGTEGPLSLNTATATELESLPGVGPVLAERIVAFRDQNGPFSVVEDLLEVSGIGEAKLAALRDLVVP
jgi:competence protein ComEA